ncbi:MAG: T9SS type A sorting domain-containing protein [Candidatus Aegiribacteria sp.]|nr:T9SS type A sorting domain-containing protein [Candidatus Aegiribacteria sp.]
MLRIFLPMLIIGSFVIAFADSAIQTDWSEGPGLPGPVSDWGDQFYLETDIEWESILGVIKLHFLAEEHIISDNFEDARSVYSEDIDGDGDMDVLGAAEEDDEITWWENTDGSGSFWTEHTIDGNFNGAISVYSADINGDSDMDVLGAACAANKITWWENSDTGSGIYWVEHTVDSDYNQPRELYSEDIDGDGDMDVLGCGSDLDNHITWWENINGSGLSWSEHTVYQGAYAGACAVYSEDIDGDGDMDVLGAEIWDMYAGYIRWFENEDGSGTSWNMHTVYSKAAIGEWSVYSEDIDGDGDMDVLAALLLEYTGYNIVWWENIDGSGTSWTDHVIDSNYNSANSIYSDDINNDGDMDILSTSYYDGISWWENIDGSGTSWTRYEVDTDFNMARSVYSEDIDGDGKKDVIGASSAEDNDIAWWNNTGYSTDGSLESSILDTECSPQWASIDWNSSEPAGTDLYFQYKTSSDYQNMGTWSDPVYEPCFLSGMLDRYFQYRVSMETGESYSTPILHDIALNWDPYGMEGDPCTTVYSLLGVMPNPICGAVSICFGLPEYSLVSLSVFDLSGRMISEIHGDEYSPGFHDILIGDLSPGIYFCRMISGDFTATQRFVVIGSY